jgi:membrane-associated protein
MDQIIHLLIQYKYFVLLPLAIIEGPILAIIVGFLCTNGFLNPLIALPVIVLGDIIGDSICYSFGRWGVPPFIRVFASWIGMEKSQITGVRSIYDTYPERVILLSKMTLGVGVAGIYLAGLYKVPYKIFIRICLFTSFCQYIMYLGIGWLFGHAYQQINHYINDIAAFLIILALVIIIFFSTKSILKKI